MTILRILDKSGLGNMIIAASRDPDLFQKLIDDANAMLAGLVDIPAGHRVKAIPADDHTSLMMLPRRADLDAGAQSVSYPNEYIPGSGSYIDPVQEPAKAFAFLVGDYILKNCR